MEKQFYWPESMYELDSDMNYEKLSSAYEYGISITGRVNRLNSKNQLLEVELSNNFTGILPFNDATIYPIFTDEGGISPNVYDLVGKKVRIKIKKLDSEQIVLSRKDNMLEALETLKTQKEFKSAKITGFSQLSAFFDVGAGIHGRSYAKEFSRVRFRDIQDVGLKKGEIISANVIEFFEEENRFEISRVDALPSHYDFFSNGDSVVCKVFGEAPVSKDPGYFVLIDNTFSGIVDSPNVPLEYGDEIVAYVKRLTDEGLKLIFTKKIVTNN